MKTKLSIIVPIYGVEKYLARCVDSILAQKFRDFELLLIDDGSRDGCPGICDEYVAKDSRVSTVHKRNAGYGAAVNDGLRMACGEYVAIVEPDDWIEPLMFERLFDRADQCEDRCDIVKCRFVSFMKDVGDLASSEIPSGICAEKDIVTIDRVPVFLIDHPSIWTCIYRRAFLVENGIRMKESQGAAWQDNLWQVQTMVLANRIAFVPDVLYHYQVFSSRKRLTDWQRPLSVSLEIHEWLSGRKIADAALAGLYARELYYVSYMVDQAPLFAVGLLRAVRKFSDLFDMELVRKTNVIDANRIWQLRLLKKSSLLYVAWKYGVTRRLPVVGLFLKVIAPIYHRVFK